MCSNQKLHSVDKMKLRQPFTQLGQVIALAIVALFTSLPGQSAMIGTAEITRDIAGINIDAQTFQKERLWIQQQLISNGVSQGDSAIRVSQLSDSQVHHVRHKFDEMPAGAGVLGVAIGVGIVLLVTDLIGLTDIYPFVRPMD
jgi:hypothetical protein